MLLIFVFLCKFADTPKDDPMELSHISQDYLLAVKDIKKAILKSRYQAAKHANKELLTLYYSVGGYISMHSREACWGSNAINTIAKVLQQELPGLRGFSSTNIKNMRTFYEQWCSCLNRQTASDDLVGLIDGSFDKFRQTVSDDFPLEAFFMVGFSHHIAILANVKQVDERLFYIRKCAQEFWSFRTLKYKLTEELYRKKGSIRQTNFEDTLRDEDFKQRALRSFKDEYLLDFINIEEPEEPDERVIENEIILNIKNFIMAFGSDFAFIGNQYHIEVDGHDYYIDLLFYSRKLRSLIAFELKRGAFRPEYTGKLNFYLSALDEYVKLPDENPSIGIVLCKSKSEKIVELSFRDTSKPMGVASFRTSKELPRMLREVLPDMEEIRRLL